MSTTTTRKGGCGCGGQVYTQQSNGNGNDCGCRSSQPCGCEEHKPREVLGDCTCEGPVRCGVPCLERPAYSAGQLLTADSLRLGQRYFEDKFALRRFVDGVGVVCGLHVRCDPDESGWVTIDPGYAIDCCGNDIVLCEPVRFNLCKAISACSTEAEPCETEPASEPVTAPALASTTDDYWLNDRTVSGKVETTTNPFTVTGTAVDGETKQPLAGVHIEAEGLTGISAVSDATGSFRLTGHVITQKTLVLNWTLPGYRTTKMRITISDGQTDRLLNIPLFKPTPVASKPTALPPLREYVLRIEGTWEGRQPVAVVTSRAGCDPRPECKPSKEAASVRLCVAPYKESTTTKRVDARETSFRQVGKPLMERLALALELSKALPKEDKDPNPVGRAVADTFLGILREEPAISSCNLYDLICDVRRMVMGGTARCFSYPPETMKDPELALIGIFGRLLDDAREAFLTLGCDDCCDQVGVRLAHVFTEDLLPECAPKGCSISIIDTHAPSRESLHPRSSWWVPDQVIVYDAYFRFLDEACVLLKSRGLTVRHGGEANEGPFSSSADQSIQAWISEHGTQGELKRLGLYEQSILYAECDDTVVLWTVQSRVVAITTDVMKAANKIFYKKESLAAYARYAVLPKLTMPVTRGDVVAERVPVPVTGEVKLTAKQLDPAPFKELLRGVGDKKEVGLFKRGITTLEKLVAAPDVTLAESFHPRDIEYIKSQAKDILAGKVDFKKDELLQWGAAAAERKALIERKPA